MFDAYRGLITISLIVAGVLWLLLAYRKTKAVASLCIVMLVGTTALAPSPATALELKRDDNVVTVSASEVIDDTLIAAGDTVLVKGTINGDLVAGGRRIDIAGTVKGNVFAFAESVTISGSVEGMVVSALIAGLLIL
jgi:lipopolysaccharide export system protein LptA